MRRIELAPILALGLATAGCMRIDSYPELPDLTVSWDTYDCSDDSVAVRITGPDGELAFSASVICTQGTVVFADVARVRYHVTATLQTTGGAIVSTAEDDADLRNGFDRETDLYFPITE